MFRIRNMPYERKKKWIGFFFVVPWLLGFAYFFLIPFIYSFVYSVTVVRIGEGGMLYEELTGLSNYIDALTTNVDFRIRLTYSLTQMAYQIPLTLVFGVFMAVILNSKFRGRMMARGIFFLPVIIASGVIINIITGQSGVPGGMTSGEETTALFQGIQFGQMLINFGLPIGFVENLMMVINSIFELVWKSGVQIILMLSGLQAIPETVYEAADVEGATAWETFWKITIPMVSPTIILAAFYTIVDVSTDYSNIVVLHIRDVARNLRLSEASTLSNIWFLIIIALIGLLFLVAGRKVFYQDAK